MLHTHSATRLGSGLLACLLIPVILAGAALVEAKKPTAEMTEVLRGYPLTDPAGNTVQIQEFAGEVVVINFWATWCKPCRREMPLLEALNRNMTEHSGRVVAISVDRDAKRVDAFLTDNKLHLPVYVDGPEGLAKQLDLSYLPYTVVLDAAGNVAFAGAAHKEKDWKEMTGLVERLMSDVRHTGTREAVQ